MAARKTSTKETRIWKYAARLENLEGANEILFRSNRYYNRLVAIERDRHARYVEIRRRHAPHLAALESQWAQADEQIGALYREAKAERTAHWRATGGEERRILPPSYQARIAVLEEKKKAAGEAAKPLREAFSELLEPARTEYKRRTKERNAGRGPRTKSLVNAEVLQEMLKEEDWPTAWKQLARSDDQAHKSSLEARAACGLYGGTYLSVEEAFQRAKGDSLPLPPRFRSFGHEGKICAQLPKGTTWETLASSGPVGPVRMERLESRTGGKRSHIYRVTLDQSKTEKRSVSAVCKLHRLPTGAEVKWIAFVVRKVGLLRTVCTLQLTLEHEDFGKPMRPAGVLPSEHLRIGWSRTEEGIRVARWEGGQVVCPDAILRQSEHADAIDSAADAGYARAIRRFRKLAYLAGHRIAWHRMGSSDRAREFLRRACEHYARQLWPDARERWKSWIAERRSRGEDLYAPLQVVVRSGLANRQAAFAWWCLLWARKDRHLQQYAADSRRRFVGRRDAYYRREAIRIATEYSQVSIDKYRIDTLKKLPPLTMPGEGVRDLSQTQLQMAAPGRFREILRDVMGPRCTPCERPSDARTRAPARSGRDIEKSAPYVDAAHRPT